jgi:hypothetical protein
MFYIASNLAQILGLNYPEIPDSCLLEFSHFFHGLSVIGDYVPVSEAKRLRLSTVTLPATKPPAEGGLLLASLD